MKILKTFFFLSSVYCIFDGGKCNGDTCPRHYCGNSSLYYPFKLSNTLPPNNCTYMNLTCNSTQLGEVAMLTPVVNLPYGGDFYVRNIAYDDTNGHFIQLYDPGDCLIGRLIMHNFNLSSSPYKAIIHENYTFYTCPSNLDLNYSSSRINCLSNFTNFTVAVATPTADQLFMISSGCKVIGSWQLPVLEPGQFEINSDLYLTWNSTTCQACQQTNDSGELWKKFAELLFAAPVCAAFSFVLVFCLLRIIKCFHENETNPNSLPEYSSTATAAGPAPRNATGLDESKIDFCTELVVVSENKRIMTGPDSNATCCSICLDNYGDGEIVRSIAKCEHCFHAYCIELWLRNNSTCPVCRTVLSVSQL